MKRAENWEAMGGLEGALEDRLRGNPVVDVAGDNNREAAAALQGERRTWWRTSWASVGVLGMGKDLHDGLLLALMRILKQCHGQCSRLLISAAEHRLNRFSVLHRSMLCQHLLTILVHI